ncbi:MAG TPA: hypothetical protein VM223_25515 [Planctomycetota bacterium]|nr:hypothetical protein [Planctomycetota bacterium]
MRLLVLYVVFGLGMTFSVFGDRDTAIYLMASCAALAGLYLVWLIERILKTLTNGFTITKTTKEA